MKESLIFYKLDLLLFMLPLQWLWEEWPPDVMKNCWEHFYFCNITESLSDDIQALDSPHQKALESRINRVVNIHTHNEISQLLNPEGKNECAEEISKDRMVERITVSNELPEVTDDDDESFVCHPLNSSRLLLH